MMEHLNNTVTHAYVTRRKLNPTKDEKRQEKNESTKKISIILKKCESLRTSEDNLLLEKYSDFVKKIKARRERFQLYKERVVEKEDPPSAIETKVVELAKVISQAKHLVCYTGAGISTSARIPDYRGSNGIWTLLQKGKEIGKHDLSLANPTFTHMALFELHRRKLLRHVVSQNCDGLHLRSGLPPHCLSEIHGNMYIEVCTSCKPEAVYWRLFDTTESTARFAHKTKRLCYICKSPLIDTIIHFGEKGTVKWPLNWNGAWYNAEKADVILCLGSSLKVLKKYTRLWQMNRTCKDRARIYVVNLQWTPKDSKSTLKINAKCDVVMKLLMKRLNIDVPSYKKIHDPIFAHATTLLREELHTMSQPELRGATELMKNEIDKNLETIKNRGVLNQNNILIKTGPFMRTPLRQQSYIRTNRAGDSVFHTEQLKRKVILEANQERSNIFKNSFDILPSGQNIFSDIIVNEFKERDRNELPLWFDVSYAYSGLHSIVRPPPPGINIWTCQIIHIFQMNRTAAECEFCFDNYAEFKCQFYKKWSYEEKLNTFLKKSIFCECCDNIQSTGSQCNSQIVCGKNYVGIQAGWYGKGFKKNQNKRRKY